MNNETASVSGLPRHSFDASSTAKDFGGKRQNCDIISRTDTWSKQPKGSSEVGSQVKHTSDVKKNQKYRGCKVRGHICGSRRKRGVIHTSTMNTGLTYQLQLVRSNSSELEVRAPTQQPPTSRKKTAYQRRRCCRSHETKVFQVGG